MPAFSPKELDLFQRANAAGRLTDSDKREIVRRQRAFDAAPDVDVSPIELPPQFSRPAPKTGIVTKITIDPGIKKAADAGVAFNAPADKGHFLASFAFDGKNKLEAYKRDLGEKARVRRGPKTGRIEYFNKDEGRFALANPPGLRLADIEGLAGQAVIFGPEFIGGATAAFVAKHPAMVQLGAGAGAFVGEIARLKTGQALGINQNINDDQIIQSAAEEGAISVVGGLAAEKIMRFGKFIIDTYNGRILTKQVADTLDMEMIDAQKVADTINDKVSETQMRFNMAQATNDEDLLSTQEMLSKSQEYRKEFGEFSNEQFRALKEYRDKINSPFRSSLDETATNEKVKDVANTILDDKLTRSNVFLDMKKAELRAASVSIKDRPFESLGETIREIGSQEQQAFKQWADDAAVRLNRTAGGNAFIEHKETTNVINQLSTEARRSLLRLQEQAKQRLVIKPPDIETIDIVDPKGNVISSIDPEGVVGVNKIFDPDEKLTFKETWDAISYLKGLSRISAKGLSTETPSVGDVIRLTHALETDLRTSAQSTALRGEYDDYIVNYAKEKRRLDEGIVGAMMTRKGTAGRYKIADDKVFAGVFTPGSDRGAKELFELVKNSPSGLRAIRESLGDAYKRIVVKDGRIDANAHDRFIRQQARSMSHFFDKKEMAKMKQPLAIEKALRAQEVQEDVLINKLSKTFDAEVTNLSPTGLMGFVMDARNPQKAKQLMNMLKGQPVQKVGKLGLTDKGRPDLIRAVRAQFTKEIRERTAGIFRNGEREFSAANFDKFLNGKGGERGFKETIREIMGEQYLDDLTTFNTALKIVSRETKFPNRSNTAFWTDTVKNISRAYVGLFTRPGRFITAMDRLRGRAANRLIAKAMLNPESMRELMALRGVSMESAKAVSFMGSMGASVLLKDFSDEVRE